MMRFQDGVKQWMYKCFNESIIINPVERSSRLIEEATELVQACGYTKEQVLKIIDYVYDRPVGEMGQEVGGLMVCLAALCNVHDLDINVEAFRELDRISDPNLIEKIRTKQAIKKDMGVAEN